jgi:hypothetical protein
MSGLLEGVARRLAGEQPVSRRDLFLGRRGGHGAVRNGVVDARPLTREGAARGDGYRPVPTAADLHAMRTALAQAAPSRRELAAFFDALKEPRSDGRFNDTALGDIARLRSRLQTAHAQVAGITHRSGVQASLLTFLTDVDGVYATLAEIGQSSDPARAARLRARAAKLNSQAQAVYRRIAPSLHGNDVAKAAKP